MPLPLCSSFRFALLLSGALLLEGCASVGQVTQLDDGWYHVLHVGGNEELARQLERRRLYVDQRTDTLLFTPRQAPRPAPYSYHLQPEHHVLLLDRRFDVDVFTIPVKVRPPRAGVPIQLDSNFNGALYVGRRMDFYYLSHQAVTPWEHAPRIRATGIGYGAFVGLGSSTITADVTAQPNQTEYEGFVVRAGTAAIYDARVFNVGFAVGLDHLLGPDRRYWIYQRKPWVGILFGLDLN